MDCINHDVWTAFACFFQGGFTKTKLTSLGIFFFYLVIFACIARAIGKREEKAKRVIGRAFGCALSCGRFPNEGLFSISGRWATSWLALFRRA